jgi:hypothetical protein
MGRMAARLTVGRRVALPCAGLMAVPLHADHTAALRIVRLYMATVPLHMDIRGRQSQAQQSPERLSESRPVRRPPNRTIRHRLHPTTIHHSGRSYLGPALATGRWKT